METFQDYIDTIDDIAHRKQFEEVIDWIDLNYPDLTKVIKWHMSISPEGKTIGIYKDEIEEAGYSFTSGLYRIKYSETVDYNLLKKMIDYNIEDKKGYQKFWR